MNESIETSAVAFFGAFFEKLFGQQNQPEELDKLREEIACYRSPFFLGVHPKENNRRRHAANQKEQAQRMFRQKTREWSSGTVTKRAAFGGSALMEILRHDDNNPSPQPVGDGVAVKSSPMRIGVAAPI